MELTEEQRKQIEANRLAAIAKRKAFLESNPHQQQQQQRNPWNLFKCQKISQPKPQPDFKFLARLEICSHDSFTITPLPIPYFAFPSFDVCFGILNNILAQMNVDPSHFTQTSAGGKACVFKLADYCSILKLLKAEIKVEEIPWSTFNVVEKLSHLEGRWTPVRPEHLNDDEVDGLIGKLPKSLLDVLLPFQMDGLKFALRRGGRCLIADEMGLGKTLQAIAIAGCFIDEGSILVVCPAVLRYSWAEEIERWLPFCLPADIHLVFGHQDNPVNLTRCPRIVVISYTMLHRLRKSMLERKWALLIVDESHHVRPTKKTSEPGEIKAVLDVASEVKRIVLLSGTPSLSRPFDIFHQINMLWPGLLGTTKYEFAKTYCDLKYIKGVQGKYFADYSKGIRLEELNVLLKQTVMIRRLKEHVLQQLPPKRRQIIRLLLKRSDIVAAKTAVGVLKIDSSENASEDMPLDSLDEHDVGVLKIDTSENASEDMPLDSLDEHDVGVLKIDASENASEDIPLDSLDEHDGKLTYQELGIAKLSGFREWLSFHPLIAGSENASKMIIFAHHHKVLDGVQEFICEKGVGFVRIDGHTLPRDRQSAVTSFRSSPEIKIAIIGVLAAGFGLDFSAAQDVVFLELPQSPTVMLQAEDRAHRRGQTNAVNIYIFYAKDTWDESHWKYLNTSLHRVSSTTDGKYDAVKGLEVERVSFLNPSSNIDRSEEQSASEDASIETQLDRQPSAVKSNETEANQDDEFGLVNNISQSANIMVDSASCIDLGQASVLDGNLDADVFYAGDRCSEESLENNDNIIEDKKSTSTTDADDNQPTHPVEAEEHCSHQVNSLRFEVSPYTGRIHLYTCILGKDARPQPLYENFRPEDLELLSPADADADEKRCIESASVKDNPAYRNALLDFSNEWKNLRPIERNKLLGKPLQLPLAVELCYLSESTNHNNKGLINGGSKRRMTPLVDISYPLPSDAVWKKVYLRSGRGKKEKEYTQGWSLKDEPLCKLCQKQCMGNNAKTPEYFEDLFCNLVCHQEYRMRTSNRFLRQELFQIEQGVCTNCQLDCHKLVVNTRPLSLERRRGYIEKVAPNIAKRKKMFEKLIKDPIEGNAWHADHIVPVYKGGGECKLENMRTLCVACHHDVTAVQCAERRIIRANARKQLKVLMDTMKNNTKGAAGNNNNEDLMLHGVQESMHEDDILVPVPGSAYSLANSQESGDAAC
ncbi:putative calcium/calmodulin-dependent protein kinase chromatin remodeling SNF2 family [Medicago truncatula]|uniref:Putative calcium/calmodulin-dependent protein kinase chromatin remodeling SNF2 family n=1 Tax=Medicago truncatula TaxID=3880 RepID=A0A396ISU0_MEDTR|nr:DNA annealing helicase and endonuclease ZRANB3 isoform X4 [Medicago truncatula]RHN66007.1 putative calcium/calmodulin-dependent protein kinase chromatin remodeling SNF2 family [Medicago truncatula]